MPDQLYTEDQLKSLCSFIDETVKSLDPKTEDEKIEALTPLKRQIQAIRYSGLLFRDICKMYDVDYILMGCPLEELPLHINDQGYLSQTLIKWRLSNVE